MAALSDLSPEDRDAIKREVRGEIEEELKRENEIRLEGLEKDLRTEIGPRIRKEIEIEYRLSQEA